MFARLWTLPDRSLIVGDDRGKLWCLPPEVHKALPEAFWQPELGRMVVWNGETTVYCWNPDRAEIRHERVRLSAMLVGEWIVRAAFSPTMAMWCVEGEPRQLDALPSREELSV